MTFLKKLGNYIWSKKFLLNILAIVLIYVIGFYLFKGCLSSSTNHGDKIEVPNLIGKNESNLKQIFSGSELEYEVLDSIYDPSKVEGTVLGQDPLPTSETDVFVKQGRTIKVRVSKRTQLVEMPKLVDKSQRFAEGVLRNRQFKYSLEYRPSQEAHGAVIEQLYKNKKIVAGTKIPIGSKIKLIIGRNEVGVPQELPDLVGLTIQEARQRVDGMLNMDFQIVCNGCVTREDSLAARVETQSPEFNEGARIASGSSIMVYASKELVPEPQ